MVFAQFLVDCREATDYFPGPGFLRKSFFFAAILGAAAGMTYQTMAPTPQQAVEAFQATFGPHHGQDARHSFSHDTLTTTGD